MKIEAAKFTDAPNGILLEFYEPGQMPREVYLRPAMVAEALLCTDQFYRGLIESSGFPVSGAPYCYELRTASARESVEDALVWLRKRGLVREHVRPCFGPVVEFVGW